MQMTKSFSIENIKSRMLTFAQICDSFASAKLTYMYIYAFSLLKCLLAYELCNIF